MASYPTILAGIVISQFPYSETDDWVPLVSDTPGQISYTATNPQPSLMRRFTLTYGIIVWADVMIIQNFIDSMYGRLGSFSFTDDQGKVWPNCRFDMDSLDVTYTGPGTYSMTVKLLAPPTSNFVDTFYGSEP